MKKSKYLFDILSMMVIILLITPFVSCINDDLPHQEEERGLIVMRLNGVNTRAPADFPFTGDEEIKKVRFLVFIGETLEKNQLFTAGNVPFSNPFVLNVATGTKNIYVIANEASNLSTQLGAITSKATLFSLLAEEITSPLTIPLTMTGMAEGVAVIEQIEPDHNQVSVTLSRIAAKVSLQMSKGSAVGEAVQITKVSLISNTGKTTLFPTPPSTGTISPQSYWNFTKELTNDWILTPSLSSNTELGDIYLYENITGGDITKATQLEIEALYNNIPTTYRVYLNENVINSPNLGDPSSSETDSDHLYSLKRGYHYKVNGTIVSMGEFDGLNLETNVLPWEKLESEVLFERIYTISPLPTTTNYTYTAQNPTDLITFTFKLSNPIGSTWVAQLSDPYDFEFSTSSGAVSAGGLGTEYTISIKPRNVQSAEERSTEFYITVGGYEIPLLQSSTSIGTGNRIIINQPATE